MYIIMKRLQMTIIAVLLCGLSIVFAQVPETESLKSSIRVIIRMDRLHFSPDDPVEVHVMLKNISSGTVSFVLYEDTDNMVTYTSFQPMVADMDGRRPECLVAYDMEGKTDEDEAKRLISRKVELHPNEEFTTTLNLRNIYALHSGTRYRVRGFFIPSFPKKEMLKSDNEIAFRLTDENRPVPIQKQVIPHRPVTPSEVVLLMLESEKNENWDRMNNFIDHDSYIYSYPDFGRKYQQGNVYERASVRESFKNFISRKRKDYIVQYKVEGEVIEPEKDIATVDAVVDRNRENATDRYRYRFILKGNNSIWLVTGVEAIVLKGVKK